MAGSGDRFKRATELYRKLKEVRRYVHAGDGRSLEDGLKAIEDLREEVRRADIDEIDRSRMLRRLDELREELERRLGKSGGGKREPTPGAPQPPQSEDIEGGTGAGEGGGGKEGKSSSVRELLGLVLSYGTVALTGLALGTLFPSRKKVTRKVIVDGLNVVEADDRLVVLENPGMVVFEERGDHLLLRRATKEEIMHSVSLTIAKSLEREFISRARSILRSLGPDALKEGDRREEIAREVEDYCKRMGELLDESRLDSLPADPWLEATFGKRLLRSADLRVVVITLTRSIPFYTFSSDKVPLTKMELIRVIESYMRRSEKRKEPTLLILGSPTGWSSDCVEYVEKLSHPYLSVMLVDLKLSKYYASKIHEGRMREVERLVRESVVEEVPAVDLGDRRREVFLEIESKLLSGSISEEDFLRQVRRLIKVPSIEKEGVEEIVD